MKCPGQDMQYWDQEAIYEVKCPECSAMVEFYKDDTTRKCHNCNHRFVNPKLDFGCASYCQFAEQCLGTLPDDFAIQRENLLKDKVAVAMKRYFKSDFKRIRLTTQIANHAEKIGKEVEGANLALILCSSYLLLIGYSSAADKNEAVSDAAMAMEGPAIAAEILREVGADESLIQQVCAIVGNTPSEIDAVDSAYAIVHDAYRITMLEKKCKDSSLNKEDVEENIAALTTDAARQEARNVLRFM